MSAEKQLKAELRERAGKGAAREVRRNSRVPAVIYGGKEPPLAISLDKKEITLSIYAGHFLSTLLNIDVDGKSIQVIPRDYQKDPVKDVILHVDFLRITKGQQIKVVIPFHLSGQDLCPGVKRGGTLQIVEHSAEFFVPSNAIPEKIDISVAELGIGDTVHLNNVTLPKDVRPVSSENLTIVTVVGSSADDDGSNGTAAE
jgi:ribosomal protein L25, Ctc-form